MAMSTQVQHIQSQLSGWVGHLASNLRGKLVTPLGNSHKKPARTSSPRPSNFPKLNITNPAPLRRSRSKQQKQRPVSVCSSANTTRHTPNQPSSGDKCLEPPQLSRRNSAPVGEHSAAARSRARYNAERRKSLSRQRSLSRSSSLRSRPETEYVNPNGPDDIQTGLSKTLTAKEAESYDRHNLRSDVDKSSPQRSPKRNSRSQPNMTRRDLARVAAQKRPASTILPLDTAIESLTFSKAQNRLSLPIIPASPADAGLARFAAKFSYNTVLGSAVPRKGARLRSKRLTRVFDNLVAQPPLVRKKIPSVDPALLAPKVRSLATTIVTCKNAERAAKDFILSTMSAESQLRVTLSITTRTTKVQKTTIEARPSTSWTVLHAGGASPMVGSFGSKWRVEAYGRRKFQHAEGFWD